MTEFLYLARAEIGSLKIAKVGTSTNPKLRVSSVFSTSPMSLTSCLLKEFSGRGEAGAWEKHVITAANRYKSGGEWVLDDALLADLWDGIDGGKDVPFDHPVAGRHITSQSQTATRRAAFAQKFRDRVGPVSASKVNYDGHPTLFNRAVISARLIAGFGADDIAVLDEISADEVRREISRLRDRGLLTAIYRQQRASA